jgi:hypothetical protein
MRILVCGGRDFGDRVRLESVLDRYQFTVLITGMARGADFQAWAYAKRKNIPTLEFPAKWEIHGKRAGYLRNQQMLDEGKPELVIAFPGGDGTAMMIRLAIKAGVKVVDG